MLLSPVAVSLPGPFSSLFSFLFFLHTPSVFAFFYYEFVKMVVQQEIHVYQNLTENKSTTTVRKKKLYLSSGISQFIQFVGGQILYIVLCHSYKEYI